MKALTTSRHYLINNILAAISGASHDALVELHNKLVTHASAFEKDGELILITEPEITDWSQEHVEVFENNDQDGEPERPYSYYCFGEACESDFNTEREAILDAVKVNGLTGAHIDIEGGTALPVADYVIELSICDPDTHLPVGVMVYKDAESGGVFGLDSAFVATLSDDEPVFCPMTERYVMAIGD